MHGRRSGWGVVAAVGSPVAVATALLVYFGWARSSVQATRLGYDISIAEYTTLDYVIRSINLVFAVAVAVIIALMIGLPMHERLVGVLTRRPEPWGRRAVAALSWAGRLCVIVGLALLVAGGRPLSLIAVPAGLTAWVLLRMYADRLGDQLALPRTRPARHRALDLVLLVALLFWDAERLALLIGEGYADAIAAEPDRLVAVTVYSREELGLAAPGVTRTTIGRADGAADGAGYVIYRGLRLLQHTPGRYLLLNEEFDERSGRVFLLTETDGVRFEFDGR